MDTHRVIEAAEVTMGAILKTAILLTLIWMLGNFVGSL